MRWERLFADLEQRFVHLSEELDQEELATAERLAQGAVDLVERLGGAVGRRIGIGTRAGHSVAGELRRVGPDWVLLLESTQRELVLPMASVVTVEGLTTQTAAPILGIGRRLDLRHVVRGIARDRSPVVLALVGGTEVSGTIDRVGVDFLELAAHAPWELRRPGQVHGVSTVPFGGIDHLRALPLG